MFPTDLANILVDIGEWTVAIIICIAVFFGVWLGISALIYYIKQKFKS